MLSYSIFSLALYSERNQSGAEGAYSLPYIRLGKLIFSGSRTLFGALRVRGKERTVFLASGQEQLSYSIFHLVLYSASSMLRVKSLQFSLHQGREVKLQHFTRRNALFRTWQKRYFRTCIFLFISLTGLTHSPSCTTFGMPVNRLMKDCVIV